MYTDDKQLQDGNCGSGTLVQTWRPTDNDNERLVGVSSCIKERPALSQCSLGLRLFFEHEEEAEEPKQEQTTVAKPAPGPVSNLNAASTDGSESATESSVTPNPVKPKAKVNQKSEIWLSGSLGYRDHSMRSLDAGSPNQSRHEPSDN